MDGSETFAGGRFVESITGWGTDYTDGSSVCFFTDYPDLSYSDDPDRCQSGCRVENASWRGSYRIEKNQLILEAHNIKAPCAPAHELGIGYTVTLKGARFEDGSRTKVFPLLRFSGNPSNRDMQLEVPLKMER